MRIIYAIPNYDCNLNCSHCQIHTQQNIYNECNYLKTLKSLNNSDSIILFGGEPTLYEDRFYSSILTGKIKSISTNLVDTSQSVIDAIAKFNIALSTSWNLSRFTEINYKKWLKNIEYYGKHNKKCMVMITMTHDLICDKSLIAIQNTLNDLEQTNGVDKILFEHLISTEDLSQHHIECDKWLCKIHDIWHNYSFENTLEKKLLNNWICECKNTYTLEPNGILKQQCPHGNKTTFNFNCLVCENFQICKPCKLQNSCTFPHKLYKKLNEQ